MKANEFIIEKKRKRKKPRWAAYGPGPFGGYGYAVGYSGDGGGIGGDAAGGEASYPGNIGVMELTKFFQKADDQQKELFKKLLEKGKKGLAWKLVQDTVGVKLQGKEFDEDLVTELKISDNDVKRIIKDRLAIDAETGIDAMKLAIDQMSSISKTSYVQSQASQLMMLYRKADMKIGGDYYRKLVKLTEDKHPNEKPAGPETKPTMPKGTVKVDVSDVYDWYKLGQHISDLKGLGKHDFGKGPPSAILSFGDEDSEHKYIKDLKKTGLDTTDIDPKSHEKKKGQKTDPTYNVGEAFDDDEEKDYNDLFGYKPLDKLFADELKLAFDVDIEKQPDIVARRFIERDGNTYKYRVRLRDGSEHDMFLTHEHGTIEAWIDEGLEENFADGKVKGKSRPGRVKRSGASCDGSVTDLRKRAKNASGEKAKMYHWCANMKAGRNK